MLLLLWRLLGADRFALDHDCRRHFHTTITATVERMCDAVPDVARSVAGDRFGIAVGPCSSSSSFTAAVAVHTTVIVAVAVAIAVGVVVT